MQEDGGRAPQTGYDARTMRDLRHDVRTPLNAVMGVAALLETWRGLDPRQQRMVEVLQSSTNDLKSRLDTLFEYLERLEPDGQEESYAAPTSPRPPQGSLRRVLLAEDYQPNALIARTFLEDMGYEVDVAHDGKEAVARFRDHEYSAILLDVQMPEIDGLEAARRIRGMEREAKRPRTPIIALTAHATRDDALFCLKAGMDDYISKPFNASQLFQKLEGLGVGA